MESKICFNNTNFVIILIAIFILFLAQYVIFYQYQQSCPIVTYPQQNDQNKTIIISKQNPSPRIDPRIDPILEYDYGKLNDQLAQPARRVSRYDIPPADVKQFLDIPTRGYPDNFTLIGLLVSDRKDENKIIRLFGRQEYPRSDRYEYYAMINSGLDKIKVNLNVKQRELYDDDNVYVKELDQNYKVQLYKYDAPKYYPDII